MSHGFILQDVVPRQILIYTQLSWQSQDLLLCILKFVCCPFCSKEQQEYKVMLIVATVALCCNVTQTSQNETWVKPPKHFPFHCFLHDSYWYWSTQWERAFCCEFILDWVHYSNIYWIICGLFSSLLKFSTKHIFFKCNALLFFPFINLGQKSLRLLCNAKVWCHCKVWLHFHKELCSTRIVSWTQSPFMLAL